MWNNLHSQDKSINSYASYMTNIKSMFINMYM